METLLNQLSGFHACCPVKLAIAEHISNQDVLGRDSKGNTLLHLVMEYLDVAEEIAKEMLDMGSPVNATNYSGHTPLQKALKYRNCRLEIVKLLVSRGADLNVVNDRGQGLLVYALCNSSCPSDVIKYLYDEGVDIKNVDSSGYSLLHHGIRYNGSLESLGTVLELGADPHAADAAGTTPLALAVIMNRADIVDWLLKLPKIKVNLADKQRMTPLHRAITYKDDINPRIVKSLLEAGANPNRQTKNKEHPLHLAADFCHPTVIALLLDYGARVNVLNKDSLTPLYKVIISSQHYNRVSAKMLLDAGALVFQDHPDRKLYPRDAWPHHDASALHHAADEYSNKSRTAAQLKRVLLLLKYGFLEKPDLCCATLRVDEQTRVTFTEYRDRCMQELQTVCMEPNITLAQFILRSRLRDDKDDNESLTDDILEILSAKPYPLYKEVVCGLLDRDDLTKAFQRHPLCCGKSRSTLSYDCAHDAAMYLGVEDLLNVLLAVYKPKKRAKYVSRSVQTESATDLIEESQRYFKRARLS